MSRKKLFKFSKGITVFCVVANSVITAAFLVLLFRGIVLDVMTVAAIYAPFSVELGYNAMISMIEKRHNHET